MKSLMIGVCLVIAVCGHQAMAQYRDFTSADGKTIRGAIKNYDVKKKTVSIERDNRKVSKVPLNIFCEADQAYILEWESAKGFSSDRLLKISGNKKRLDQRKEKEWRDIPFLGGGSEEILLKETTFERFVYEFEFRNMNASALENIRMEYIIFYEQSETVKNEKPEMVQKFLKKDMMLPALEPRKNTTVTTEPLEVFKDNINGVTWSDGAVYVGGEGDVHGVRVRLYMKMPSGNEIVRAFSYPTNLSETKFSWE